MIPRGTVIRLALCFVLGIAIPASAQTNIPTPFATNSRAGKVIPDGVTCNVVDTVGTLTCGGGTGSGTVNAGTTPQAAYYATSTTAVSGASGVMFPNANSVAVGSPTGTTATTGVVDVASGYWLNGVSVGQVVAGTSQTVSAAQWAAGTTFVVTSASQTLTLPASTTLSPNGGIIIQTVGVSAALAPNGSDTINAVNATKTIGAGVSSAVTTNAAGAVYATPTSATTEPSIGWIAAVNPNKAILVTVDRAYRVSSVVGRVSDATGGTATAQVFKVPSGTACSGGTALTSDTLNANGTANTNQTLTLVGGAADDLAAGDSLCLVTTGTTTWTGGTGIGGITVSMAPL